MSSEQTGLSSLRPEVRRAVEHFDSIRGGLLAYLRDDYDRVRAELVRLAEKVATLDQALTEWDADCGKAQNRAEAAESALSAAQAEIERLRGDAARLDWLQSRLTLHVGALAYYVVNAYEVVLERDDGSPDEGPFNGATLREAIDAALAGSGSKEEGRGK